MGEEGNKQSAIRNSLRGLRKTVSEEARLQLSADLVTQLHSIKQLNDAKRVGVFLSMCEEISMDHLNACLLARGISRYLPVVKNKHAALKFAYYGKESLLVKDLVGIQVPDVDDTELISGHDLDVCFVPLVGFDLEGNRIGMGGGYYDRTFDSVNTVNSKKTYLVGVAYDCQRIDMIARNEWDVKLDAIITPTTAYKFYE